ncbi:MAG: hypothetical protein WA821_12210 [Anaerolineales bacterium]
MKTKIWSAIILAILLVSCAPVTATSPRKTPVPTVTLTPIPSTPTATLAPITATPDTLDTSNWATYTDDQDFFVTLKYPADWQIDNTGNSVYSGPDGFFQISAVGLAPPSFAKPACEMELQSNRGKEGSRYGSRPTMEILRVDQQSACVIFPSDDQPKDERGLALLIIDYPRSFNSGFLQFWADKDHMQDFIASLKFVPQPASASSTPTAPLMRATSVSVFLPASSLPTGKVFSIPFGQQSSVSFRLDDHYIYWIAPESNGDLFRASLNGGNPEQIAVSKYPNGRLDLLGLVLSGKWLIFADTDTPGISNTWMLRALNLEDGSERRVMENENNLSAVAALPYFNMYADGDWLVWNLNAPGSSQNTISMLNLATGEKRELPREEDGAFWSSLAFSAGQAIVEKDFDEQHGSKTDIYMLDPATGKTRPLSTDGENAMPLFAYPWVVWKTGFRNGWQREMAVYNLQTQKRQAVFVTGEPDSDPRMDGARIYWTGVSFPSDGPIVSIYVFDILKNTTSTLDMSGDKTFDDVVIHGKSIAWVRRLDSSSNDSYLEWTTIQ